MALSPTIRRLLSRALGNDGEAKVLADAIDAAGGGSGNLTLSGNTLSAGNTNGNVAIAPNGTGKTDLSGKGIFDYLGVFNDQVGTTYTLQASDTGKVLTFDNGSAITVTLPNSLVKGFNCRIVQLGAGTVTVSAAGGATVNNRQTQTSLAGQFAEGSLLVTSNTNGSLAVYNFSGDTA